MKTRVSWLPTQQDDGLLFYEMHLPASWILRLHGKQAHIVRPKSFAPSIAIST